MKAKDYAIKYQTNPTIENLTGILIEFFKECFTLADSRRATTEAAQYAILNEQDQKWRAFARLVKGVKENGLEMVIKERHPELYQGWQRYRERKQTNPRKGQG